MTRGAWRNADAAAQALANVATAVPAFQACDLRTMLDRDGADEPPQLWTWDQYAPCRDVTLLSGHGGHGKSYLALALGACIAAGSPFLGREVRQGQVIYMSAEDPEPMVRRRLRIICRALGLDLARVLQAFTLYDATSDAVPDGLMFECSRDPRHGLLMCTPTAFGEFIATTTRAKQASLIVDNASIVFAGEEINRRQTGTFIRWLRSAVRDHDGMAMLLAHVNAQTARKGKDAGDGQNFSGSTAWHNAARSRLFLLMPERGRLDLHHEKNQHGPTLEPLRLEWPHNGIPSLPTGGGMVAAIEQRTHAGAILKLLCEFHDRGEFVSTAKTGRNCAPALFAAQRGFPRGMKPAEVFDVLRQAERLQLVVREQYRNGERKERERFAPTAEGRKALA